MDFEDVVVTTAVDVRADLGEGPCWDARSGTLLFVDISAGHIYRYDPVAGSIEGPEIGQEVGAAIPRVAGGLVVAMRDGVGFLLDGADEVEVVAAVEGDEPGNRMNDATCDPQGRLWAGTMAFDFTEGSGLALPDRRRPPGHPCVARSDHLEWHGLEPCRRHHVLHRFDDVRGRCDAVRRCDRRAGRSGALDQLFGEGRHA